MIDKSSFILNSCRCIIVNVFSKRYLKIDWQIKIITVMIKRNLVFYTPVFLKKIEIVIIC